MSLAAALADRYLIERELGQGGMATVYLAEDLKHHRKVAVKVLRPDLAAALGAERFTREIEIGAQLQHPHILPLLDSGEANGFLYYVMPYIDGESLRERLTRVGELPVHEAVKLLCEIVDALSHAHARGVVHRDIKPDNIMLSGRHALVMDFGVAKAVSEAGTREAGGGRQQLTTAGVALGTPTYMAPEQATADPHLDHRVDIYAVGVLAYELLAGRPPFTGASPQQVLAAHVTQAAEPLSTHRPTISPALAAVVMKCLAKRPSDRWQTADELLTQLEPLVMSSAGVTPAGTRPFAAAGPRSFGWRPSRTVVIASGLLLVGALAAVAFVRRHLASASPTGTHRLAVLPFDNLGAPTDEYFADGMTDAVRGKLAGLEGMQVIARASSNQYRRSNKPLAEIGQELGVRYLLTGTVRWERNAGASRVQVSPELVELPAGTTAWQQPFDASLTDVFQVQADVAEQVARALGVALGSGERQRLAERPTQNLAAYDAFLRGDQLLVSEGKVDAQSARQAMAAYRLAVERDSSFALAWARLARAAALLYSEGDRKDPVVRTARHAAERVLALAPNQAETHYAIAYIEFNMAPTAPHAGITALERARTLAPRDPDILSLLGSVLVLRGRVREALAYATEAARLDPKSVLVARRRAYTLLVLRKFAEADSVASAALPLAPGNTDLVATIVQSRVSRGDTAAAHAALRNAAPHVAPPSLILAVPWLVWLDDSLKAIALRLPSNGYDVDLAQGLITRATVLWTAGRYGASHATADSVIPLLEAQLRGLPNDWNTHSTLALAYANAGRRDDAVREAERARDIAKPEPNSVLLGYTAAGRYAIELLSGNAAAAVGWLDTLLRLPGATTRESIRLDPGNAPLRGRPDFEKLVSGKP